MAFNVVVFPPNAEDPQIDIDLERFMGTWHVIQSTLPLWKSRKDVTITYTLKPSEHDPTQIDDLVEYRSKSDSPISKRSSVVGVDTLVSPSGTSEDAPSNAPKTRWKWRGKGWLMIATSRWQILGCHLHSGGTADDTSNDPEWALTYFEKTLFTPAGLDIYSRAPSGLPTALLGEILTKAKALGGEVGALAVQFFEVERSAPQDKATSEPSRIGSINKVDVLNHVALTPS
ncbi:hypothetical protein IEO21_07695 [Rhodonia placenta]|uniref:Uncharacterized protein n=1 Tax=Rhodonia placenta TaxID=104341 RepID=A0A8H7NXK0_9APHY|nr:hypothetical protein IEO21_07695 [Postia placenta]